MKPRYRLILKPSDLTPESPGWSSKQLLKLLKEISSTTSTLFWYLSDIWCVSDCLESLKILRNDESGKPWFAGDLGILLSEIEKTDYFYSGVFLGIENYRSEAIENLPYIGTEDEEWRDILDAKLEVRLFDTSNIEVYSSDFSVVEMLAQKFNAKARVETCVDCYEPN